MRTIIVTALLSLTACSSSSSPSSKPTGDKPTASSAESNAPAPTPPPAPAAAAKAWVKLAPLPLQMEIAEAKVTDNSTGDLKSVGIETGTAMFSVNLIPSDMKQTLDQIASGATSNGGGELVVKEKLADGFHVESRTSSGFITIDIRRTLGGKDYMCGSLAPDADTAKLVREACLSLKAG